MKPFPSDEHLSSWAGLCPANEESAGKRKRRRITPGNRWLKQTLLAQAGWAASHTKNTYLASQYRRLAGHRGKKRALIAVGHTMLVIFYHMIKSGASYAELGGELSRPSRTRALAPLLPQAPRTSRSQGQTRCQHCLRKIFGAGPVPPAASPGFISLTSISITRYGSDWLS